MDNNTAIEDIAAEYQLTDADVNQLKKYGYATVQDLLDIPMRHIDKQAAKVRYFELSEHQKMSFDLERFKQIIGELRLNYADPKLPCRPDGGRDGSGILM